MIQQFEQWINQPFGTLDITLIQDGLHFTGYSILPGNRCKFLYEAHEQQVIIDTKFDDIDSRIGDYIVTAINTNPTEAEIASLKKR
jgi:hypothetical protein